MNSYTSRRFYRSSRQGKITGVCAGVAEYFNLDVVWVRVAAVIGLFLFTAPTVIAYVLTTVLADKL